MPVYGATLVDPTGHNGCPPNKKCPIGNGSVVVTDKDGDVVKVVHKPHKESGGGAGGPIGTGGDGDGASTPIPREPAPTERTREVDWAAVNAAMQPVCQFVGRGGRFCSSPDKVDVACRFGLIDAADCTAYQMAKTGQVVMTLEAGLTLVLAGLAFLVHDEPDAERLGEAGANTLEQVAIREAAIARILTQGESAALTAVRISSNIVLGLEKHGLQDTAKLVGGRVLVREEGWMDTLKLAASDPKMRFTISLDGFEGADSRAQVMRSVQLGLAEGTSGGYTNWELALLYQAGRLETATFVKGGQMIPNPLAGN